MRGRALLESEICRMTENIRDCEISYFIQMTVDFISRSSKSVKGKMVWKHYQQEMLEDSKLKDIILRYSIRQAYSYLCWGNGSDKYLILPTTNKKSFIIEEK